VEASCRGGVEFASKERREGLSFVSRKLLAAFRYLAYLGLSTALVLLAVEGVLRLAFGLPKGLFYFRPLDNRSLYLPNATLQMVMGPVPYTVKTNSLGFRGPEIALEKPAGVLRIAALGDSVTDGFYVDNDDTYPAQMERCLRQRGIRAEVVNAARGNSSIDAEYAILRRFVLRLNPDWVALAFVANDIDDLRGVPKEGLVTRDFEPFSAEQAAAASESLLLARTALGELVLDASLRVRYENYRRFQRGMDSAERASRYRIPGQENTGECLRVFLDKHAARNDSILLYKEFTPEQRETIDNYCYALDHMRQLLQSRGVRLLFVYTPGYNEIHDPDAPVILRAALRTACEEQAIPFVDTTPAFQAAAKKEILDLAPVDFHFNPAGNRVLSETVAAFLESQMEGETP